MNHSAAMRSRSVNGPAMWMIGATPVLTNKWPISFKQPNRLAASFFRLFVKKRNGKGCPAGFCFSDLIRKNLIRFQEVRCLHDSLCLRRGGGVRLLVIGR